MPGQRSSLKLTVPLLALGAFALACAGGGVPGKSAATTAQPLLRFAAYGDTRDNHDVHRDVVAKVMGFQPALVLQTGDLVHHGDAADEWAVFDDITAAMRRTVAYYPARGNHDVSANGYYEARVTSPVLSGNKLHYSFERGGVHFIALDTQEALAPGSAQRRWLEEDLGQAQAAGRLIVPFFHKAIFSVGPHAGEPDVVALRPILHPLFRKYGVKLVFQGHDHIYYRTVRDGITYVVTGGGGAPLYDLAHQDMAIPGDVSEKVNHFCIADVFPGKAVVTAYRRDLTRLDVFEVAMPTGAAEKAAK
jgi:3',5'-cyclic AMP phosphodiesterase CpdA